MHLFNYKLVFLKAVVVFVLSSSVSIAQSVSLTGNLDGMEYSAKISYQHDCYFSEPLTRATLHSVYINSFTYNGKTYRGNDLGEVSFPIEVEEGYLRISGRVRIDQNSYVNLPPTSLSLSIGGGGHAVMADAFNISADDLKSLGMEKCDEWIPRAHEIRDLKVLEGNFAHKRSFSWKSDLESLVQKKLKEEEEKRVREENLNNIQEQIEQTDDPDKKMALLKESKKYGNDPQEVDAKIAQIQREKEMSAAAEKERKEAVENNVNEDEDENEEDEVAEEENSSKAAAAEKQIREREEAEEQERQRRRNYELRKQQQNRENAQIASASAAASVSFFYLLGGVIYTNYGKTNPNKLYKGSNLFTNFDIGLGLSVQPIYFASEYENADYEYRKSTKQKSTITFDLDMSFQLGYETDHVGGYAFGSGTAGISPIFDAYQLNYNYGGRAYAGLKNLKVFAEYEEGARNLSSSDFLDSKEYGSGKSNHGYANVKAGIRISWYGSRTAPARNHIYLGLIEEKISTIAEGQSFQRLPTENKPYVFNYSQVYTGYMFEWRHDHHGLLFAKVFPKYPATGMRGGSLSDDFSGNDGWLFFQVGFVRSFTAYY